MQLLDTKGPTRPPNRLLSFETLFRTHHGSVRAFVARRVLPSEVDDVVAETFTTVWRRRNDLPEDENLYRAWVLRTANYTLLNERRSRKRRLALVEKLTGSPRSGRHVDAGDPYTAIATDTTDHIERVFASLSAADQLVLTLAAWDNLSVQELAVVLECSENAATTRLSRARSRFRSCVEEGEQLE